MPEIDAETTANLALTWPVGLVILFIVLGAWAYTMRMQAIQNNYFCKTQNRDDEREEKILDIVANSAAANQKNADAIRELGKTIKDLADECHRKIDRERDDGV